MSAERFSKRRLTEINEGLSDRDKSVLRAIQECRYITTGQLQRLHFTDAATPGAALRAASRNLVKLKDLGLIESLERRVGGVRSGSGANVWYLKSQGEHMLRLAGGKTRPRHPASFRPSPYFQAHVLAVTECFTRLTEICGDGGLKLISAALEPECWRPYNHLGKQVTLKPDLFAITVCGDYEDRWFWEIDRDTEAPVKIVEKCRRYYDYYRSGLEQKQHEVFPLCVWIVPDTKRKESVTAHIRAEFVKQPKLFIVITPDELDPLLRQGIGGSALC